MKTISLQSPAIILIFLLSSCQVNHPEGSLNLNSDWKFKLLEENIMQDEVFHDPAYDDSKWETVSLPHTAHLEPLLVNDQWQGICWYRRVLDIPKSYKEKKIFFELEAAMSQSTIWVNGKKLAQHQGGYLPVVMDITNHVIVGKPNNIAVRLDNRDNPMTGPKPLKILDFNMYGGLYRNAWLSVKDKVYISHPVLADKEAGGGIFISFPRVSEEESIIRVKTHIINEENRSRSVELVHTILYNGEQVFRENTELSSIDAGGDLELNSSLPIRDAKLWSPETPNLYQLETSVLVDGVVTDKASNRFGIREFIFEDNDLYINGKKTYLRGVNRHQEYPYIGYALSDNAQYRDAKKIKEAGFNFIRLSHYPHSPAFMDACDELGLVVLDAILGWQYYLDEDQFREYCYRSTTELIRRDRNHACVLAWEASLNETGMPVFFMEELHRIVHAEYPGEMTYSAGWMDDVYDIYLQARQHRIRHYNEVQEKPYVVSEYGDWEYYSGNPGLNQHNLSKQLRYETSSRQHRAYGEARLLQQAYNIQEAHNDNFNTPAFADGYWVMFDYNRGYHDDIEVSGIMDIFRIPKFSYYFFASQKDPSEKIELSIASFWTPDSPLDVKIFSNCDEVELYLNGSLIGRQTPDQGNNTAHLARPPFTFEMEAFEAGSLKAIGFIEGVKRTEQVVKSPEKAAGLKVWIDESGRAPQAACNDVLFLYIAAVDKNGTIIPDYTEEIDLDVSGDVEVINQDEIIAEAGIATALIKIGNTKSEISIMASSEDLSSDKFVFEAK